MFHLNNDVLIVAKLPLSSYQLLVLSADVSAGSKHARRCSGEDALFCNLALLCRLLVLFTPLGFQKDLVVVFGGHASRPCTLCLHFGPSFGIEPIDFKPVDACNLGVAAIL